MKTRSLSTSVTPSPQMAPMASPSQSPAQALFHQLHLFTELRFTGRVQIQIATGPVTKLYFCLGRLVWFAGGDHPIQRWRRLLTQFCPEIKTVPLDSLAMAARGTQGYEILSQLHRQGDLRRDQIVSVIETALEELLFDLIQEQESVPKGGEQEIDRSDLVQIYADTEDTISSPVTLLRMETLVEQAHGAWQMWKNSGLAAYSPNLAPRIRSEEQLRQQTTPQTYEILSSLVDGERSLRSLALKLNQPLITLTRALLPYITHGVVSLVEIPSLGTYATPTTDILPSAPDLPRPAVGSSQESAYPLVVCIDDSPHICKSLAQILTPSCYQVEGITNPMEAIPKLLKLNPDLIFLDLVMPVANGYEICAQIRRISLFKEIPIIILTGNDGIVDRVRAKWVGATEFLSKPVEMAPVLDLVDRYLRAGVNGACPCEA